MDLIGLFFASEFDEYTLAWDALPPALCCLWHHPSSSSLKNPPLNSRKYFNFRFFKVLLQLHCFVKNWSCVATLKVFHEYFTIVIWILLVVFLLYYICLHLLILFYLFLFYLIFKRGTSNTFYWTYYKWIMRSSTASFRIGKRFVAIINFVILIKPKFFFFECLLGLHEVFLITRILLFPNTFRLSYWKHTHIYCNLFSLLFEEFFILFNKKHDLLIICHFLCKLFICIANVDIGAA